MKISFLDPSQQLNNAILNACLAWILISLGTLSRLLTWRLFFQMRQLILELYFSLFASVSNLVLYNFLLFCLYFTLSQIPYIYRILALTQSRSCSRLGTWSFYKPSIMLWSSEKHELTVVLEILFGVGFLICRGLDDYP